MRAFLPLLVVMSLLAGDVRGAEPTSRVFVYKHSAEEPREIEVFFPPAHEPAKAKVPGMVLFHGGAWTGGTRRQFLRACEYFASRGLVTATVDYRKLTKAEARAAATGEKKRVCITDAKSAIRWFKSNATMLGIDPARVITGGGSAGGHISILATTNPGLNDPADPLDVSTSVVAYVLFNPAFTAEDQADPEIDALQHVGRNLAPAIAFFGTKDTWKPGWDAAAQKLKDVGNKTTEVQLAEGMPHGFFNKDPWQAVTLIAADRFLVRQGLLQGEPTLTAPETGERLVVTADAVKQVGPWNLTALKQTPEMRWVSQDGPVHSLLYRGEPFQGRDTEVFAFYASPATLRTAKAGERFPGVVLIHGGGGTAFAEWTWLWAKRGYAAIAMDLSGSRPNAPAFEADGTPVRNQTARSDTRTRLENGGPFHGHPEKFDSIGGDVSDDWPYHAAASVIRAHSLLRSFPEVIADRTAVTGISWGGYTTCLVASLDDRFKAAVPVYGCGFLHEGESVQKPSIDKLGDRRKEWVQAYDPSSLLLRCRIPILFVNGTNDVHYPLDSYQKSFDVVPGPKQMRIEVNMQHGHPPGWAPEEIGLFVDSFCRDEKALPVPGEIQVEGDVVRQSYSSDVPLKSAALHYTTDDGLRSSRTWKTIPAEIGTGVVTAPRPPAEANTWFLELRDERGAMVSSTIQFRR
ncbi:Carboxylesterase NlhH [Caulifigura coniformis]|uniref:Carboxylesterase NlhH n=1 Tax=Caulifigura coniformis TaxID=2527983 RepID=A0A517SDJ5_9PLAN|nr:alpha/beta hydrolase fold domain-containing protein [Caulifigura coniformis]QDT54199.1 Carboxylesterase NlhH [Caulifigura coniformis]